MQAEEIFRIAVLQTGDARARLVDEKCGSDQKLKAEVWTLLKRWIESRSHDEPTVEGSASDNDGLSFSIDATLDSDYSKKSVTDAEYSVGDRVGNYALLRPLGQGGMGTVWLAEQSEPVRRKVALKLIRSGVGSVETIARFKLEQQALALMDHPNVARIFEAGTTETGAPWFAMELVQGVPLGRYCDEKRLTIRQRLQLFVEVCSGVQHAHQKGIIHRDLKPSNILVTEVDQKIVPKVIDFGLAKAIDAEQRLSEVTMLTGVGQFLGTVKYMSPEQAGLDGLDIDTRTDVYALGVILYELLTGCSPLNEASFRGKALVNLLQMLRDQEPLRPSIRLSESSESIPSITSARRTDGSSLRRVLTGDLDWVVMKALEKDRSRRYDSVTGLAEDIQRFLDGNVVEARPPSVRYRVGKFVRKNRVVVGISALLTLSLLFGIAGTTLAMFRAWAAENQSSELAKSERLAREEAERDRNAADAAAEKEKLARLEAERQRKYSDAVADFTINDFLALTTVEGQERLNDFTEIPIDRNTNLRQLLDRAAQKLDGRTDLAPEVEARLRWIIGVSYRASGESIKAIPWLSKAAEIYKSLDGENGPMTIVANNSLAAAFHAQGDFEKSTPMLHELWLRNREQHGHASRQTFLAKLNWAMSLRNQDAARGLEVMKEVSNDMESHFGAYHRDTLMTQANLASTLEMNGDLQGAAEYFQKLVSTMEDRLGSDDSITLSANRTFSQILKNLGRGQEAVELLEKTSIASENKFGIDSLQAAACRNMMASEWVRMGRIKEAVPVLEETTATIREKLGKENEQTISAVRNLASAYRAIGQTDESKKMLLEALEWNSKMPVAQDKRALRLRFDIAQCHIDLGEYSAALQLLAGLPDEMKAAFGGKHPDHISAIELLGTAKLRLGKTTEAIRHFEEALRIAKQMPSDASEWYLTTQHNLAGAYLSVGRVKDSIELWEQTVQAMGKAWGGSRTETLSAISGLAGAYRANGRIDLAVPLWEQAVKGFAAINADSEDYWAANGDLAFGWEAVGRKEDALELRRNVVAGLIKLLGPDHPRTLTALDNLAGSLSSQSKYDEAFQIWEDSIRRMEKKLGESHFETLRSMHNKAVADWRNDRLDRSIPTFEIIVQRRTETLGPKHPETLRAKGNLGVNYKDAERYDEAIRILEEVYDASLENPKLAWLSGPLLEAYAMKPDQKKAIDLAGEIVFEARSKHAGNKAELARELLIAGISLRTVGALSKAEPLAREAAKLYEDLEDGWDKSSSQALLGGLLFEFKKKEEARPYLQKGFEGLIAFRGPVSTKVRKRIEETAECLIQIANEEGNDDQVRKIKVELEKIYER